MLKWTDSLQVVSYVEQRQRGAGNGTLSEVIFFPLFELYFDVLIQGSNAKVD